MRTLGILFSIAFILLGGSVQAEEINYDYVFSDNDGICLTFVGEIDPNTALPLDGKFGYMRENGEVICKPQWANGGYFYDGAAIVTDGNQRSGMIDENGTIILDCAFDSIGYAENGLWLVEQNGRYGVVDQSGGVRLDPKWQRLEVNEDKTILAWSDNGKCGVMDEFGTWIISPEWDYIYPQSCEIFRVFEGTLDEGGFPDDGFFGFVAADDTVVSEPRWTWADDFVKGVAIVVNEEALEGVIAADGRLVIECLYDTIERVTDSTCEVSIDGYSGTVNNEGQIKIPVVWEYLFYDQNETAIACGEDEQYGVLDENGNWLIQPRWAYIHDVSEGYVLVSDDVHMGVVDLNDQVILTPAYEEDLTARDCWGFSEGKACVKKDGRYGYIDTSGNLCIEADFLEAERFHDGYALVREAEGRLNIIDADGHTLLSDSELKLIDWNFGSGLFAVENEAGYSILDVHTMRFWPEVFDRVEVFQSGSWCILWETLDPRTREDDRPYIIDSGRLLPFLLSQIEPWDW